MGVIHYKIKDKRKTEKTNLEFYGYEYTTQNPKLKRRQNKLI